MLTYRGQDCLEVFWEGCYFVLGLTQLLIINIQIMKSIEDVKDELTKRIEACDV